MWPGGILINRTCCSCAGLLPSSTFHQKTLIVKHGCSICCLTGRPGHHWVLLVGWPVLSLISSPQWRPQRRFQELLHTLVFPMQLSLGWQEQLVRGDFFLTKLVVQGCAPSRAGSCPDMVNFAPALRFLVLSRSCLPQAGPSREVGGFVFPKDGVRERGGSHPPSRRAVPLACPWWDP